MNREETRRAAEVMLHFADGGEVEIRIPGSEGYMGEWSKSPTPTWQWGEFDYRKAPPKPVKKYVGLYRAGDTFWCGQPKSKEGLVDRHSNLFQIIEVEEPAE